MTGRAHTTLVISLRVPEWIVEVGSNKVDGMLSADSKDLQFIEERLVGGVWDWLMHTTFVFVMEMPVYVCPHLLRATSTPSSKSLITRRKKRQALRRSCDTGMRSAQSGDCVLPAAGARRYKANYRGFEGEH